MGLVLALPPTVLPEAPARSHFAGPERRAPGAAAVTGPAGAGAPWCPTGRPFLDWLEARTGPLGVAARPRAKAHEGPTVSLVDGVVVMEDDGSLTNRDRRIDLAGTTLVFEPAGDGFVVSLRPLDYDEDVGSEVFTDQRQWRAERIDLTGFPFPFGGSDRTEAWVTSTSAVTFAPPSPPPGAQLLASQVLLDRTPRVGALQQGASSSGWTAFVRQAPERAVFTWRRADGGLNLDVQVVLFPDGTIHLNHRASDAVGHGTAVVVTGNETWWAARDPAGEATDPSGDLDPVPRNGGAVDLVAVRAEQVAGSELLAVELELAEPLPTPPDGSIQFSLQLRDEPGEDPFRTTFHVWEGGGNWGWTTEPTEDAGNVVRIFLLTSDMPLRDDDVEIVAWAGDNWEWRDVTGFLATLPRTPPTPLMGDFSVARQFWSGAPLFEAFTRPELRPGDVYRVFREHFADPRVDGLAIYQNFLTDIVFYAGAYSTVGNPGADGIGVGSSAEPEAPALLHMNALRYGWNANDAGKVTVLNHEFGHHWLYFLSIMEGGEARNSLNPASAHPAGWVHAPAAAPLFTADDASCMGGSTWRDNGDGTFTSPPEFVSRGFSWHELYLMGLAEPAEVVPWGYLRDADPGLPASYWPGADVTVTATWVDVSIDQVIEAEGPRFPAATESRRSFVVPMVLVVRPGEWTQDDVDEVRRTCEIWSDAFAEATLFRADVTCDRVGWRPPDAVIVDPDADVTIPAGTAVSFVGRGDDPDGDAVRLTWSFDGQAPDATGEGPHEVIFPRPGTFDVVLGAEDATGLTDETPASVSVEVTCRVPEAIDLLFVRKDVGNLHVTWTDPVPLPDVGVLLESLAPEGGFAEVASAANDGAVGLRLPTPDGDRFFRMVARNLPDCTGP